MSDFLQVGDSLVPISKIRYIDCSRLMIDLVVEVHTTETTHVLDGAHAVDVVMRAHPGFFEGRRFRWVRHMWAVHNLIGHPVLQLLSWARLPKLGMCVHDITIPRPVGRHRSLYGP